MFLKFILQLGTGEKTVSSHSGVSSGYADIMAVTWMHSSVTDMSMNDGQQRKPGIVGLESGYPKTCHMHTPFFGTELLPTALSTIFTSYRYQDRTRPSFALQCWTGIKPLKLILCKYSDWNLYVWMYMYNIVFTYIHIIIWTHTCTNSQIRISILYCAHNLCEGGKAGSFGGGVRHSSGSVERLVQGACGLSKLYTSNGLFEALDFIFISFLFPFGHT